MKNKESRYADVVIAGGGASGLAAAVELGMKAPHLDVLVIEKMEEPGRKLRATGSGRCNISNVHAEGYERIGEFFRETGLMTRAYDNGLVYPYSESASDVVRLLTDRAAALGVRFACGEELMSVRYLPSQLASGDSYGSGNVFLLESVVKDRDGMRSVLTQSSYIIMAMGGKSGPTFGTTGDGYRIARNLGHTVVTPVPALTSVECAEWEADSRLKGITLAGTRTKAEVSLYRRAKDDEEAGELLFREAGELQFTKYGLSGICVFNMTRHMRYDRKAGESLQDFIITADLFPDGDIGEYLKDRRERALPSEKTRDILTTVLKDNIAAYVIDAAGGSEGRAGLSERPVKELDDEDAEAVRSAVHCLSFHPVRMRGWNDAQVTMGGVSLDEIDAETSASRLIDGLYITGELADRDYPCGGYNLSNAWITGLAAADSIARAGDK